MPLERDSKDLLCGVTGAERQGWGLGKQAAKAWWR